MWKAELPGRKYEIMFLEWRKFPPFLPSHFLHFLPSSFRSHFPFPLASPSCIFFFSLNNLPYFVLFSYSWFFSFLPDSLCFRTYQSVALFLCLKAVIYQKDWVCIYVSVCLPLVQVTWLFNIVINVVIILWLCLILWYIRKIVVWRKNGS